MVHLHVQKNTGRNTSSINWYHHRMDEGWNLSDTVPMYDLWADDYGRGSWEPGSAEEQAERRLEVRSNFQRVIRDFFHPPSCECAFHGRRTEAWRARGDRCPVCSRPCGERSPLTSECSGSDPGDDSLAIIQVDLPTQMVESVNTV